MRLEKCQKAFLSIIYTSYQLSALSLNNTDSRCYTAAEIITEQITDEHQKENKSVDIEIFIL